MPVQTHFDFRHPTRIVHGPGSIACLADCFSPADKVLIVSDQVLGEIGTVEAVTTALGDIPTPSISKTVRVSRPKNPSKTEPKLTATNAAPPSSASAVARPWTWPR